MGCKSDEEENYDNVSWDTEEEEDDEQKCPASVCSYATPGPSTMASSSGTAGPSRPSLVSYFVEMGYPEETVVRAVNKHGNEDPEAVLNTLLHPSNHEEEEEDDDYDDDENEGLADKDRIVSELVEMGFPAEEASSAIDRCGPNAPISELTDSIEAARIAQETESHQCYSESSSLAKKRRKLVGNDVKVEEGEEDDDDYNVDEPMVGFGLPFERRHAGERKLPEDAHGPPYFYFETPKGASNNLSRFVYDIEPEYVDSGSFSVVARKSACIHNLPVTGRFPLRPIPPKTIHEAFPVTRNRWPQWDPRTQLECLENCSSGGKMASRISKTLAGHDETPPRRVQDSVLAECRKGNLIWVGHHKAAALEPDEIETVLGFPRNHTRGGGISMTDRYKSLGSSFQIDTVAYHLSVLKDRYPNGMNILSLFSGIGGAEVALHRLGIELNTVVSVERSQINRNIVKGWWEQTGQTGNLIQFVDVEELKVERLEHLIGIYGQFDLIIGGSPGEGKHSAYFHCYWRILDLVKEIGKLYGKKRK